MFNSVEFKKDFRTFKKGDRFEFKPGVNILVGDQGCGKSTILELLRCKYEFNKSVRANDSSYRAKSISLYKDINELIIVTYDKKPSVYGFDFERESPRDRSAIHHDMISEQLFALKSSHGESNTVLLDKILREISNNDYDVVLLDEPDSSLSPRNCYNLLMILKSYQDKWNKQLIVSAQNPILIYGRHPLMKNKEPFWKEILSLEYKKWMTTESFMIDQLIPPSKK